MVDRINFRLLTMDEERHVWNFNLLDNDDDEDEEEF
jgi:hypothetical protein